MPSSWIIGARSDCDVVVDVASVSGRHCRLSKDPAGFFLEDLRSTNGTFVNGVRLAPDQPVALKPEDAVHLGSHALDVRGLLARVEAAASEPLEFHGRELVVGRSPECDCVIDRAMVSSRHARLFRSGDETLIEDLKSANGTFVNGKRIDRATAVRPGDTIGLGTYSLTLAGTTPEKRLGAPGQGKLPVPDPGRQAINRVDPGPWPIVALLAQAPLAALMIAALARSSLAATLFGLVMIAVWFGLSSGIQEHLVDAALARFGVPADRAARFVAGSLALIAIGFAQCLVAWVTVSNAAGLGAETLPGLGLLVLACWVGLILGALTVSLLPDSLHAWGSAMALLVAFGLLGGWRPSLQDLPAAIRPLSGLAPSRWAFEGLLLLEAGEPDAAGRANRAGPPGVRRDAAEVFFPSASERMGLAADALALVLMLIGLAAIRAYLEANSSVARSADSPGVEPAAGMT